MIVHGGAGPDSKTIQQNIKEYQHGLKQAVEEGYSILDNGGSSLDAIEVSVKILENHPLFNAGRGSALNSRGEIEMCASIMDGRNLHAGAVALVRNVKNPVSLARAVMERTHHIFLGAAGAMRFARDINLDFEDDLYFITSHELETFEKRIEEFEKNQMATSKGHGTVGAVACDSEGNIAAATSTGGMEFSHEGRIADSPVVGAGVYANNKTCAVSATGDGEYIIQNVVAFDLSCLIEYGHMDIGTAAFELMHKKLKNVEGDVGFIAVDSNGDFSMQFNSQRMHRGWKTSSGEYGTMIYKN
jgi:beta-aspartyl-peptidase (threonine type)